MAWCSQPGIGSGEAEVVAILDNMRLSRMVMTWILEAFNDDTESNSTAEGSSSSAMPTHAVSDAVKPFVKAVRALTDMPAPSTDSPLCVRLDIQSDCLAQIEKLALYQKPSGKGVMYRMYEQVVDLSHQIGEIDKLSANTVLSWIPGHAGVVPQHELADELAGKARATGKNVCFIDGVPHHAAIMPTASSAWKHQFEQMAAKINQKINKKAGRGRVRGNSSTAIASGSGNGDSGPATSPSVSTTTASNIMAGDDEGGGLTSNPNLAKPTAALSSAALPPPAPPVFPIASLPATPAVQPVLIADGNETNTANHGKQHRARNLADKVLHINMHKYVGQAFAAIKKTFQNVWSHTAGKPGSGTARLAPSHGDGDTSDSSGAHNNKSSSTDTTAAKEASIHDNSGLTGAVENPESVLSSAPAPSTIPSAQPVAPVALATPVPAVAQPATPSPAPIQPMPATPAVTGPASTPKTSQSLKPALSEAAQGVDYKIKSGQVIIAPGKRVSMGDKAFVVDAASQLSPVAKPSLDRLSANLTEEKLQQMLAEVVASYEAKESWS